MIVLCLCTHQTDNHWIQPTVCRSSGQCSGHGYSQGGKSCDLNREEKEASISISKVRIYVIIKFMFNDDVALES